MDLSFGGFNNIIDASNITFKDARVPSNPVTSTISYDHDLKQLNLGEIVAVKEQMKINRTLNVTVENDRFKINEINDFDIDLKLIVGEKITFNLNSTTNNDDVFFITRENNNTLTYEANNDNNVLKYYLDNVEYNAIEQYRDNYNSSSTRSITFEPKKSGTYYYKSLNETNKGGTITVINRDGITSENNCDVSFNKSIQVKGNTDIDTNLTVNNISKLNTLHTSGNVDISGSVVIDGDLKLNSNTIVEGDISLNKSVDINNNLTINGTTTFKSTLDVLDNVNFNNNLQVNNTITTENYPLINKNYNVTVVNNEFIFDDVSGSEFNFELFIGEKVTFHQNNQNNNDNPLFITNDISNSIIYEASNNNVLKYYLNNVEKDNITEYNLDNTTSLRRVEFIPNKVGVYYCQSKNNENMRSIIHVNNHNTIKEFKTKNVSFNNAVEFNNNNVIFDYSTNYIEDLKPRIQFFFHTNY